MNSRVSWSVEGIDPSVRERAEAAARRAADAEAREGVTLAEGFEVFHRARAAGVDDQRRAGGAAGATRTAGGAAPHEAPLRRETSGPACD